MKYGDDDLNVVTCDQHGTARVYGPLNTDEITRNFLYSRQFTNYGNAKLWADEYEGDQRKNRPVGRR